MYLGNLIHKYVNPRLFLLISISLSHYSFLAALAFPLLVLLLSCLVPVAVPIQSEPSQLLLLGQLQCGPRLVRMRMFMSGRTKCTTQRTASAQASGSAHFPSKFGPKIRLNIPKVRLYFNYKFYVYVCCCLCLNVLFMTHVATIESYLFVTTEVAC